MKRFESALKVLMNSTPQHKTGKPKAGGSAKAPAPLKNKKQVGCR
jgi:hypothetical protein